MMIPPKANPSALTGQRLVGARIKVWWPIDKKFYEGVVESYSSSRRKHRVLYDDGDEEYLFMRKEKWELIEDGEDAEDITMEEEAADDSSDDTPEPVDRKKGKSNGKSSGKRKVEVAAAMPRKKLKIDSAPKSSRTRSGRQIPKPSETNGNIGGKIVAAASRMRMRSQRKENGKVKQTDDVDSSDEETLSSFMEKLKEKKQKEESSRNEEEEESSGSETEEEDDSENESGEDSSESKQGEGRGRGGEREESEGEESDEESEGEDDSEGSQGGKGNEVDESSEADSD